MTLCASKLESHAQLIGPFSSSDMDVAQSDSSTLECGSRDSHLLARIGDAVLRDWTSFFPSETHLLSKLGRLTS